MVVIQQHRLGSQGEASGLRNQICQHQEWDSLSLGYDRTDWAQETDGEN